MGTTKANSSSTLTTVAEKVSGSLSLTLANKTQCDDLASTSGKTAMQKMLRSKGGISSTFALSNIGITVTRTANRRRLSVEGRRLSAYTGKVDYVITVPVGSTFTAAALTTTLTAVTASEWKTAVQTFAAAEGKSVAPTAVVATAPTKTAANDASFAKSTSLMVGLMMMFRALL